MGLIEQQEAPEDLGMGEAEVHSVVRSAIEDAADFIDQEIGPKRELGTRYYRGDPLGNEEEGRSQVVSRDVHDSARSILQGIVPMFFGTQRVVEFIPRPGKVEEAEQATDAVNYNFTQENPGYRIFWDAGKDALVRKAGIIKSWWDDSVEVTTHEFSGLSEEAVVSLLQEPDVEILALEETQAGMDLTVRRRRSNGVVRHACLPGEEFLISPDGDIDTAHLVAHRCEKTVSDLVAMGYDFEVVKDHVNSEMHASTEKRQREPYAATKNTTIPDITQRKVLYVEAYIRVDFDGDGISELRRICTLGSNYEIVSNKPWDFRPFADLHTDPEPHVFFGQDVTDQTKDIQKIKSALYRSILDSASHSLNPRMAYVEGQVNVDDLLNTEVGALIRQSGPGMVSPLSVPFIGRDALPIVQMFDGVKEQRTNVPRNGIGLDPDALQSSTKTAVDATVEGARRGSETIARHWAEGMRKVFRNTLRLMAQHQDKAKVIRLRDEWVEIDPSVWDATMDVQINVALGSGRPQEQMAMLREQLQWQNQVLTSMGPNNPLVTVGQARYTMAEILKLGGREDVDRFWKAVPLDWEPEPKEPEPSMEEQLIQAQIMATNADAQLRMMEIERKREETQIKDTTDRLGIAVDAAKAEAQHEAQVDLAIVKGR